MNHTSVYERFKFTPSRLRSHISPTKDSKDIGYENHVWEHCAREFERLLEALKGEKC